MARKTKQDWLTTGGTILIESGAQALTIDGLLKKMGVTKGSFYHHFAGYDDYIAQFLTYYEDEGTFNIINICDEEPTPSKRMLRLINVVTSYPPQIEVAMRAWAQQDERVRELQRRVDAQRLDYLLDLLRSITRDEDLAQTLAQLTYSILIGSEHIIPPISGDAQRLLFKRALSIYGIVPRIQQEPA